jgi:hypothetical protein
MQPRALTDFMLTGAIVIPGVLAWLDQIGLALSVFSALFIAACLCGWREQVADAEIENTRETPGEAPAPGVADGAPRSATHARSRTPSD